MDKRTLVRPCRYGTELSAADCVLERVGGGSKLERFHFQLYLPVCVTPLPVAGLKKTTKINTRLKYKILNEIMQIGLFHLCMMKTGGGTMT